MDLAPLAAELRRITVGLTGDGPSGGSGVVWAPGWVVTNAHVVPRAHVLVARPDGGRLEARVVARDHDADLALVRVPGLELDAGIQAPAGELQIGALVVAVGHPLGVRWALTTGIVHALAPLQAGGRTWIQGDLRLAPGNSGGPLADVRGRVVGINTMLLGTLALAIPVSDVERFVRAAG